MKKLDRGLASYFISGIDTKQNLQTVPAIKYSKIHINSVFQDFQFSNLKHSNFQRE